MDAPSISTSLVDRVLQAFDRAAPPDVAHAHCDIPCGIYDPHMAQIAAVVNYVRSNFDNHYTDTLSADDVAAMRAAFDQGNRQ